MDKNNLSVLKRILQQHPFFESFDNEIIEKLINSSSIKIFQPGEVILQEGAITEYAFYLLLEGQAEGTKYDNKGNKIVIAEIIAGDVFGEGAILGEKTRAISLRAISPVKVLAITKTLIYQVCDIQTQSMLFRKSHANTSRYLANVNHKLMALIDLQKSVGLFVINLIVFLSIFAILAPKLNSIANTIDALWITPLISVMGLIFLITQLLINKIPLSFIGIKRQNLKQSLIESTYISLIVIALLLIIKVIFIKYTPIFPNSKVFNTAQERAFLKLGVIRSNWEVFYMCIIYCVHSFFQEILARGSIQTTFKYFFTFKYKNIAAIILASLVFSAAHSHLGIGFVLSVFFPGLLWGWMFERQGNIFGAALSHALIGVCYIQFIGPF